MGKIEVTRRYVPAVHQNRSESDLVRHDERSDQCILNEATANTPALRPYIDRQSSDEQHRYRCRLIPAHRSGCVAVFHRSSSERVVAEHTMVAFDNKNGGIPNLLRLKRPASQPVVEFSCTTPKSVDLMMIGKPR